MNESEAQQVINEYLTELYPLDSADESDMSAGVGGRDSNNDDALVIAKDLFAESVRIGVDAANLQSERVPFGEGILDDKDDNYSTRRLSGIVDDALGRLGDSGDRSPLCSLRTFSSHEYTMLLEQGRVARVNIFDENCANYMPDEIDHLINEGLINPAKDRAAKDGTPLEWITSQGPVWDADGRNSDVLSTSRPIAALYDSLISFAESYNATLVRASGDQRPLTVAADGIEMNVNCVISGPAAQWTGLHSHQDMRRFTDGLRALPEDSVRHTAVRARVLTVSAYFRREDVRSEKSNDVGGGLTFTVPTHARSQGDRAVFDIVPADHNTGAIFLAGTVHGVARMPANSSVRYSVQAFFPSEDVWTREIKPRIDSGELGRELDEASQKSGRTGWR